MPQPKDATIAVNYPNYDGLAVSKQGDVLIGMGLCPLFDDLYRR